MNGRRKERMGKSEGDKGRYVREECGSDSKDIGTTLGVGLDGPGGKREGGVGVGRGGKDKSLNTNSQIQEQTVRWRDMNYVCTRWYRSINRETQFFIYTIAEGIFVSFPFFVVLIIFSVIFLFIFFDRS